MFVGALVDVSPDCNRFVVEREGGEEGKREEGGGRGIGKAYVSLTYATTPSPIRPPKTQEAKGSLCPAGA